MDRELKASKYIKDVARAYRWVVADIEIYGSAIYSSEDIDGIPSSRFGYSDYEVLVDYNSHMVLPI